MSLIAPARPVLADALWPESTARRVLRMTVLAVVGAALLTLSAKIQVPMYPVPMTLQTLVVLLLGAAYGPRLAVATVALYIAQGMAGLPVFANTPPVMPGPLYLLGPTGGFLVGFLVAAYVVGWFAERGWDRSIPRLGAAMLIAHVLLFVPGVLWLAFGAQLASGAIGVGFGKALVVGLIPFALGTLVKVALGALLVPAAWSLVTRR